MLQFDKNLKFNTLTSAKLNEFIAYQTSHCITKEKTKNNYVNSTIIKNLNLLKWFLKWAEKKGYNVNPDYKTFSPNLKAPAKPVIFLNWDELMKMYNYDLSHNPNLEIVRDGFCLSCFTSLRYSDLANLRKEDITDDTINITTLKTTDTISIDLNKYSKAILNKYKDHPGDKAMPVLSNQKMNDNLKIIAKLCEFNTPVSLVSYVGNKRETQVLPKYELISTHCGRRTFICNALSLGIAPNIVMKWTGHSDYKTMKPYIDIAENIKKESMSLFDKL